MIFSISRHFSSIFKEAKTPLEAYEVLAKSAGSLNRVQVIDWFSESSEGEKSTTDWKKLNNLFISLVISSNLAENIGLLSVWKILQTSERLLKRGQINWFDFVLVTEKLENNIMELNGQNYIGDEKNEVDKEKKAIVIKEIAWFYVMNQLGSKKMLDCLVDELKIQGEIKGVQEIESIRKILKI